MGPAISPSGADESVARAAAQRESLAPGARLDDFEIVRTLGNGGFGTVYLAHDRALDRQVAIKEYLPAQLAYRAEGLRVAVRAPELAATYAAGLRSFVNEAKILARFNHPAVVKVHRFWEANGTAYMVMPWVRGPTLREVRRTMKTPPTEAWLRGVLDPLLDALALLHAQGIYHRDIAPDNVLLPSEQEPVLLDFGAARRVIGDRTQTFTAVLKPSFAPIEQYAEASTLRQGPWTDLYALGAVIVYMLTAVPPPPSTVRSMQDEMPLLTERPPAGVSASFLAAVQWALAVRPQDRPQSVHEFCNALDGLVTPPPVVRMPMRTALPAPSVPSAPLDLSMAMALARSDLPASGQAPDQAAGFTPTFGPAFQAAFARTARLPDAAPPAASTAWDPTLRLSGPPQPPAPAWTLGVPAPKQAPSRSALLSALGAFAALCGVLLSLLQRGPAEPPASTWRAIGAQQASSPAGLAMAVPPTAAPAPLVKAPAEAPAEPMGKEEAAVPALRTLVASTRSGDIGAGAPSSASAGAADIQAGAAPAARTGAVRAVVPVAKAAAPPGAARAPVIKRPMSTAPAKAKLLRQGPQEACADRSVFTRAFCIHRQCETPRLRKHPHCVALRQQAEERRLRSERG